jgi:arylsulfatase A
LYFALPAPHTPWLPLKKYVKQSQAGDYGDYMVQVDHSVGRILSTLDKLEFADDTLVIFTSDNGPVWFDEDIEKYDHRSSHFLRGIKSDSWEGGHRMPFIARWPGKIEIGSVTDETICFTDMLATFAAVAHTPLPENGAEDSYNVLPALTGKKTDKPIREATVIGDNAIIKGEWKLIIGSGAGWINKRKRIEKSEGELYHISMDPSEKNNLYAEKPTVVKELKTLLDKYKQSGRSVPR